MIEITTQKTPKKSPLFLKNATVDIQEVSSENTEKTLLEKEPILSDTLEGLKQGRFLEIDTCENEKQKLCATSWKKNDGIKEIVYGGAKGGGKSFIGVSLIFSDAFTYPGTRYFIARKQLNDLRKHTVPSIMEVFALWGINELYYNYNGQDNVFHLYNGSKVYLLDAKFVPRDPEYQRFGSMQFTRGWIEEAGEFEMASKTALSNSTGRWMNDKYKLSDKLLMTCNPSKNFLYKEYYKPFKAVQLSPDKIFIQAFIIDNKRRQSGYMEKLDKLTGSERQRLLLGNWEYDNDPNTLIEYDAILNLFLNDQVKNERANKYITADVARMGSDKAVIACWRGWEVIELIEFDKSKINMLQQVITTLRKKWGVPHANIVADEDGVGGGLVDNLRIKGFVNNSSALVVNGKKGNYQNLKTQCYYYYARKVSRGMEVPKEGIYISCELSDEQKETIIAEHEWIKSYDVDMDSRLRIMPKEEVKKAIGHSPDYTDTFMMRMIFELKYSGQLPTWY